MANLTNMTGGDLYVGSVKWEKDQVRSIRFISQGIIDAVNTGRLSSDVDVTPVDALSDIVSGMKTITDSSTGTAATPVGSAVTVAAVSSTGAAANAIATLIVELTAAKAVIAALVARVELLENHAVDMEAYELKTRQAA